MERPEIISKLSYYLIDKEPLIYLFILNSDFILDESEMMSEKDFAGVMYANNRVQFYYTNRFLSLPLAELYFILIHEAYHVFKKHLKIHENLTNFKLRNIAEDAIINSEILETKFLGIQPKMPSGEAGGFTIPKDFKHEYSDLGKDAYTTPRLYNWYSDRKNDDKKDFLLKNRYCKNESGQYGRADHENGDGSISTTTFDSLEEMLEDAKTGGYSSGSGHSNQSIEGLTPVVLTSGQNSFMAGMGQSFDFETMGFQDTHFETNEEEAPEEVIPQRVFTENLVKQAEKMIDNNASLQAAMKSAGIGHENGLIGAVKKLLKSEVNWRKEFKQGLNIYLSDRGIIKGEKQSYITHLMNPRSRYGMIAKHRLKTAEKKQNYVFLAIDTSGSCFYDEYDKERFFTEIDSLTKELEFNGTGKVFTLMWDSYVVSDHMREYRVGDWKNFNLQGGGGTSPECVFKWLKNRTEIKGNTAIMQIDERENLFINDLKKLPFLLFLTDGYFYRSFREEEDLWLYKKDLKSLMFLTRSEKDLPPGVRRVVYR